MAITVQSAPRPTIVVTPRETIIGNHYRRVSKPHMVYVAARDPRDLTRPLLVSLTHGNSITVKTEQRDFIAVNIKVEVSDA